MHRILVWSALAFCAGIFWGLTLALALFSFSVGVFAAHWVRNVLIGRGAPVKSAILRAPTGGFQAVAAFAAALAAAAAFGAMYGGMRGEAQLKTLSEVRALTSIRGVTLAEGVVDSEVEARGRSVSFAMRLSRFYGLKRESAVPVNLTVWVSLFAGRPRRETRPSQFEVRFYTRASDLKPGDEVAVYARFSRAPPGRFADALMRRGIRVLADGSVFGVNRTGSGAVRDAYTLSAMAVRAIFDRTAEVYGAPGASFLLALAAGDRSALQPFVARAFVAFGMIHALVASGATVRMIVGPVVWILRKAFPRSRWWFPIGLFCVAGVLFLTGFAPPSMRAAVAYSYGLAGRFNGRRPDFWTGNAIAALVLALVSPSLLFDPGVTLTYAAVLVLAFLPPKLESGIFRWIRWRPLRRALSRASAAEIGISPVIAEEFGQFSLLSPVVNLVLYPLLEVLLPVCAALVAAALAVPGAAGWLRAPVSAAANGLLDGLQSVRPNDWMLQFPPPPAWTLALPAAAFAVWSGAASRYTSSAHRKYSIIK